MVVFIYLVVYYQVGCYVYKLVVGVFIGGIGFFVERFFDFIMEIRCVLQYFYYGEVGFFVNGLCFYWCRVVDFLIKMVFDVQ